MGATGVKELDNVVKNPLGLLANYGTGGLLGFEDGKFSKGMITKPLDEAAGELTGRNMGRDQAAKANAQVDAEAAQRTKERADELAQLANDDLSASFMAQGTRNTASQRANRGTRFNSLGAADRDFLGL